MDCREGPGFEETDFGCLGGAWLKENDIQNGISWSFRNEIDSSRMFVSITCANFNHISYYKIHVSISAVDCAIHSVHSTSIYSKYSGITNDTYHSSIILILL